MFSKRKLYTNSTAAYKIVILPRSILLCPRAESNESVLTNDQCGVCQRTYEEFPCVRSTQLVHSFGNYLNVNLKTRKPQRPP
jgi:hypothetical protein